MELTIAKSSLPMVYNENFAMDVSCYDILFKESIPSWMPAGTKNLR
jgi:hypothetical protein